MARFDEKRQAKLRGKNVTFASKKLKSGETAYYRAGKRVTTPYQKRLAKGILTGKTPAEARGHPFGKYEGRRLTQAEIEAQEEFHLGAWAEPPTRGKRGKEKATYYFKVMVTKESKRRAGSPEGEGEACTPVTLALQNPDRNTQDGLTYAEVSRHFERYALATLRQRGLDLCTGNLSNDLIHIWRHTRR